MMKNCVIAVGVACLLASTSYGQMIREYNVLRATTAPTIDGVDSPGEWNDANGGGGSWTLLRNPAGTPDSEGASFRALYDDDFLYIQYRSNYGNWLSDIQGMNPAPMDFGADNLNFYFDPNTLGEPNTKPDGEVNGYQVAFNQYPGFRECGGDGVALTMDDCSQDLRAMPTDSNGNGSTFGTYTEAHVDGLFGNQGEWAGMRLTQIAQTNSGSGGVAEVAFAWADFDALATTTGGADSGLNSPMVPNDGDEWFFNISRISSDGGNLLPVWNWTSSNYFSSHGNGAAGEGHGVLVFGTPPECGPTDFDGDMDCDIDDLDALVADAVAGNNTPLYDLNGDGSVNLADVTDAGVGWLDVAGNANIGDPYLAADINLDGVVDGQDFIDWNANKFSPTGLWSQGDLNADGLTDGQDFIIWNGLKFMSSDVSAVPEPASLLVSLLGLLGLGMLRRR